MATDRTSAAILDAAERLFASRGVDATSIREVTRAAGVNVAAVNYHFGDKAALVRAVTSRLVAPLNERRFHLLDVAEAAAAPSAPTADALVDAFVRPDIETIQSLGSRGPTMAHFLGRVYSDQTPWIQEMAREQFDEAGARFFPLLRQVADHLDPAEFEWRTPRIVALIVHTFATWPDTPMSDREADRTAHRLVRLVTAVLTAPAAG